MIQSQKPNAHRLSPRTSTHGIPKLLRLDSSTGPQLRSCAYSKHSVVSADMISQDLANMSAPSPISKSSTTSPPSTRPLTKTVQKHGTSATMSPPPTRSHQIWTPNSSNKQTQSYPTKSAKTPRPRSASSAPTGSSAPKAQQGSKQSSPATPTRPSSPPSTISPK